MNDVLRLNLLLLSVDYVVPEINQSILDAFNKQHEFASEKSCCDFNLHVCLTWWSEKVSQEMEVLVKDKGKIYKYTSIVSNVNIQAV